MEVEKPIVLDLLNIKAPALSSTDDMPKVEVKPDVAVAAAAPKEEAKVEAKPEAAKTISESATEHTEEVPGEPAEEEVKKPSRGVQKRLDELAKREADAVRRAEALQAMLDRELAAKQPAKTETEKPVQTDEDADVPKRPLKAHFADNEAGYDEAMDTYIADRAAYEANKAVKADRAEQEQQAQQKVIDDGNKAVRDAYVGRVEKAKAKYADYQTVAESPDVTVSIPMAHAIMHSEHGPDIAYHLGKNPAEAARISKLPPPVQLVELGLIAAGLMPKVEAKAEAKPEVVAKPSVSNAPKPIKPLGAGSEAASKSAEEESMDEYAVRRKKELAAQGRPGTRH